MNNPYRKLFKKETNKLSNDFRLPGQSSPIADNKGEINASNYADLLMQIGRAMKEAQTSQMVASRNDNPEVVKERREVLLEAFNDKTNEQMAILGEALSMEIKETSDRSGFVRRLCQYNQIGQGEVNQVTLREKDVVAFLATSPVNVTATEIRQKTFIPPEFHINGFILIDTGELSRSKGDLLTEKYEEGLEAIMVQEDRLWKRMAVQASTVRNTNQTFTTFNPAVFSRLIHQVSRWGIPPAFCLFSSDLWQDVVSNPDFASIFDPVTKWELLQDGVLGSMLGVTILTDNFRQPNMKVLEPGEIFVIGAPENHGVFTERGMLTAEPVSRFDSGEAKKGWFLDEICSLVIGNVKSVSRGQKL